jgi:hypothetical protein
MATLEFKIEADIFGNMTLTVKRGTVTRTATMPIPSTSSGILHLSTGSYIYPKFEFIGIVSGTTPTVCASINYADMLDTRGSANMSATLTVRNNPGGLFGSVAYWYTYSNNHTNSVNRILAGFNASHSFTYYVPSPNIILNGVHVIIGNVATGFRNMLVQAATCLTTNNPADITFGIYTNLESAIQTVAPSTLYMDSKPFTVPASGVIWASSTLTNTATGLTCSTWSGYSGVPTEPVALVVSNTCIDGTTYLDATITGKSSQLYGLIPSNIIQGFSVQSVSPVPITPTPAAYWS